MVDNTWRSLSGFHAFPPAGTALQYLVIFAAVAWIWAPGAQSFQYALYSQARRRARTECAASLLASLASPVQALGHDDGGEHAEGMSAGGVELAAVQVEDAGDDADSDADAGVGSGSRGKSAPPPVVRAPVGTFIIEDEDDAAPAGGGGAPGLAAQLEQPGIDVASVGGKGGSS